MMTSGANLGQKHHNSRHYNTDGILHQCAATADITTCCICGNKLADSHTEYTRKTRDVKNGVLTETEWEIRRRYCRKCQMYCSAEPPGTLPNERFGIIIISQILIMRCMGMTYDKIMQILQMVYGERTVSSTLTGISERTAKRFWPIYNSLLDQIIDSRVDLRRRVGVVSGRHALLDVGSGVQ